MRAYTRDENTEQKDSGSSPSEAINLQLALEV